MIVTDRFRRLVIVYRQEGADPLTDIELELRQRFLETGDTSFLDWTPFEEKARVYGPSLYYLDEAFAPERSR